MCDEVLFVEPGRLSGETRCPAHGVWARQRWDDEMLYMKACPRCQGDVEFGSDMYGQFLACLQCGYIIDSKQEALTVLKAAESKQVAA